MLQRALLEEDRETKRRINIREIDGLITSGFCRIHYRHHSSLMGIWDVRKFNIKGSDSFTNIHMGGNDWQSTRSSCRSSYDADDKVSDLTWCGIP